jgi:hypothetical protein
VNQHWKKFIEDVPWVLARGKTAEVGDLSPPGSFVPASREFEQLFPELQRLLSKACVTPVIVADAQYRLFTWSRRDGAGCGWLSPLPSTDPPSCLFAQHRILLASFGGIVERSNEPDWWIANHDALTESVAQTDGTFLKYWAWAFEEKPIPIDMEQFYVIAEEVNANRTLCHRLSGEIVLFAHDHLFDHVKRYPGWRENTLYRLPAARYFREWVNAVAFQWRCWTDAVRF